MMACKSEKNVGGELASITEVSSADREARMQEIVRQHQLIKDELHQVCVECCEAQREVWKENALARRNGRRPNQTFAKRCFDACAKKQRIRIDAQIFQVPETSNDDEGAQFQFPKRTCRARVPHPPGRIQLSNSFDPGGDEAEKIPHAGDSEQDF